MYATRLKELSPNVSKQIFLLFEGYRRDKHSTGYKTSLENSPNLNNKILFFCLEVIGEMRRALDTSQGSKSTLQT